MQYPIAETFTSIQGEGAQTGMPAYFIRMAGCNKNCSFCDTDHKKKRKMSEFELLEDLSLYALPHVVITGGEPSLYNLKPLIELLQTNCYEIYLETNGSRPIPLTVIQSNIWITVSPKDLNLNLEAMENAREIKFLCGQPGWKTLIEKILELYPVKGKLYLMPIADGKEVNPKNIELAMQYCYAYSEFSLCIQAHKYLNII